MWRVVVCEEGVVWGWGVEGARRESVKKCASSVTG
jgi:hypothetical protein